MEDATQKNLEGEDAFGTVGLESKTTTTYTAMTAHFFAKVSEGALEKIMDLDDPEKRRKRLYKKVRARPDAETIPTGAKAGEGALIIERLMTVR